MIFSEDLVRSRYAIRFSPDSMARIPSLMAPVMIRTMIPMSAIEMVNSRRVNPWGEFIFIKELVIPPNPPLEKWGLTEARAIRWEEDPTDSDLFPKEGKYPSLVKRGKGRFSDEFLFNYEILCNNSAVMLPTTHHKICSFFMAFMVFRLSDLSFIPFVQ